MLVSLIIYAVIKTYLILNIFQQAHYQFRAYLKHFLFNFIFYDLFPLVIILTGIYTKYLVVEIVCCIYLLLFSLFYFICRVKLKFTKRIIRLWIMSILLIMLISFIPVINYYLLLFYEISIILVLAVDRLISYWINRPFIINAKNKISAYKGNIIGITGSCGKTSTKILLDQALNLYTTSAKTEKSYNTELGISKFINNCNIFLYKNLIIEYGASHKNDIKKLKDIAVPSIVFVTEIGLMHVDTFGDFENIINEKMSILNGAEIAVLNYECKEIREYPKPKDIRIISYGINYGDYRARNIKDGSFDFYYRDSLICSFNTKLIGRHQVLNFLGVVAYIYEEGYSLRILKRGAMSFRCPKNRLEIKRINNMVILDDSFNSNYKGFIEALNVLKELDGKRIILTPGMVELGKYKKELFTSLAEYIISSADVIILIGYYQTKDLYRVLKEYNKEVFLVRNFMEGYRLFLAILKRSESCNLLIENDLPDLYRVGLF